MGPSWMSLSWEDYWERVERVERVDYWEDSGDWEVESVDWEVEPEDEVWLGPDYLSYSDEG